MPEFLVNIDRALFVLLNQTLSWPPLDGLFLVITHKYFYLAAGVLAAVYLGGRYRRPGLYGLAAAAVGVALADLTTVRLLKPLFARARPPFALEAVRLLLPDQAPSPSLPSAHAANTFAFAFVVFTEYKRAGAALFAVALAVSYSRVYVGVHYPFDVAAGAAWGIFIGICAVSGRFYLGAFARRGWYLVRRRRRKYDGGE